MRIVPAGVSRPLLLAVLPPLLATVVGVVALWPGGDLSRPDYLGPPVQLVDGTVAKDVVVPCQGQAPGLAATCRVATVRLTSGPDRDHDTALELPEGPGQPRLRVGDRVVLGRTSDPEGVGYYFSDFQRRTSLIWLGLLFAVAVVAVGRLRGLAALVGLGLSFALLVSFVLPSILQGHDALLVSIVGSSAIMFLLMYMAHGVNDKTTVALLGTLASLVLTGVLAAIFVEATAIAHVTTEETAFLQVSASQVSLQGLLLGSIIIGSLGVLNDVTVTQASAVWALRSANPAWTAVDLYRAAMRIGRDHIASTVDTLVLAYAGASLPLLLLFTLASRPLAEVLTGGLVAEEVVRTLVGSIGLVASVPLTTGLAAVIAARHPVPTPPTGPVDPHGH
ncbi:MAG: hypothetical protein QOD63_2156 [Actinomycetota bacterium]|jgi:uncharacterized membrane protein|nr:hypothetical protein [Actinomycetota bacterium]